MKKSNKVFVFISSIIIAIMLCTLLQYLSMIVYADIEKPVVVNIYEIIVGMLISLAALLISEVITTKNEKDEKIK